MKQNILSILCGLSVLSATALMAACQTDTDDSAMKMPGDPIEFGAVVYETDEVRTRALDSVYIASDPFDMDFYIQLCCRKSSDKTISEIGTYVVPSGYGGRLASKPNYDQLEWNDLDSPHTFYAWNIPWNDSQTYTENDKYAPDDASTITNGINIHFYPSSGLNGYKDYKNNAIYENFIGTKSDTYSYREHGKYVELVFHHLVSKIKIGSFVLIKSDNSVQENLKADITFVGMPTEAIFYPHHTDDGRPRVEGIYDDNEKWKDDGVTYYVENERNIDEFYICPEIDFSKIDFKVQLKNEGYESFDTYYGTFDNVEFERKGEDYDSKEGGDEKILHAGEMMTLNITLIPGVGPGLALIIEDWSTKPDRESQYHPRQGIYSDEEVKEMHGVFAGQKSYGNEEAKDDAKRLFEMYGSEERDIYEDGEFEMVFPLYDNVDIRGANDANIFPIPEGCVLDGMGHTITLKSNYGSNGDFGGYFYYFNVGPVRDVYLTDGTYTIYIDKDGYVWVEDLDKPGDYKKTVNQLTKLAEGKKSYDINIAGKVHQSGYYNNSPGLNRD